MRNSSMGNPAPPEPQGCHLGLQANAAVAEEAFATRQPGAGATERQQRRVWGPRPPPQHGALVAGRLVLAAVGHAEGRTLVADVGSCYSTLWACQIHSSGSR